MPYQHKVNIHHRQKRARRLRMLAKYSVVLAVLICLVITLDWVWNNVKGNQPAEGIESKTAVQSSTINIFRTPYFQFQADRTWSEVQLESHSNNVYVYRSYNDYLVQHEIRVEVNSNVKESIDNTTVSRVLPVEIKDNNIHSVGDISPSCKDLINDPSNRQQQYLSYKGTTFACDPDSNAFEVSIGLVGGNTTIVNRTSDKEVTYKITYRDSTFTPNGHPLIGIINSFQLL